MTEQYYFHNTIDCSKNQGFFPCKLFFSFFDWIYCMWKQTESQCQIFVKKEKFFILFDKQEKPALQNQSILPASYFFHFEVGILAMLLIRRLEIVPWIWYNRLCWGCITNPGVSGIVPMLWTWEQWSCTSLNHNHHRII